MARALINSRLKARRIELRLSQQELGTAANIAQWRISYLENGVRPATADELERLAAVLGVDDPACLLDIVTALPSRVVPS